MTDGTHVVHKRDSAGRPQMAETALAAYAGDVVPNDDFFVVHHYEPPPADANELGHVRLTGVDGTTIDVGPDDLRALGTHTVEAVVECAGNGRGHLRPRAPGTQFGRGLVGAARWEGVPVRRVIEAFGLDGGFATLVVRGLDGGWVAPENVYSRFDKGLPSDKALHPDTIVAWSMNGEPLPFVHGGPLRLVVPGWTGVWWVKWISEIACTNEAFAGFWQNQRYRYLDGAFAEAEVVREQLPRALVLSPLDGDVVRAGQLEVSGRAWSGGGAIAGVEVSADGGRSWTAAELEAPESEWSWTSWRCSVDVEAATVTTLCARATDESGGRQDWDSRANRLGYGNNGIMCVTVRAAELG